MARKIRILFVDDSADIIDLYQRLINRTDDLECIGTMESTAGMEAAIHNTLADVAVVDLVGTGRDAFEAIRAAAAACPQCRIIVFSGHDDPDTRAQAKNAGACSLVSKTDHHLTLINEIRRTANPR
ncbi:MAG: response regulator [Phycisphaerales bacterium]